MQKKVTILDIEERKSQKGNKFRICQCIVHGEKVKVGELAVFKADLEIIPGDYIAVFDVTVDFDRRVSAELVRLVPFREAVDTAVEEVAGRKKAS